MSGSRIGRFSVSTRVNTILGWVLIGGISVAALVNVAVGRVLDGGFALVLLLFALAPVISLRSLQILPPWEVIFLAALPILADVLSVGRLTGAFEIGIYLAIAALALMLAVDLDLLTPVEMTGRFAVFLVVVTTMATAGVWALARWTADFVLGNAFPETFRQLMIEFIGATLAGLFGGLLFAFYFRRFDRTSRLLPDSVASRLAQSSRVTRRDTGLSAGNQGVSATEARSEHRFLGLNPDRQKLLTRILQFGLAGILALGVLEGNTGIVVNAAIGLAATFLPAFLHRDYDVPLDVRLTLWIAIAVFAHAVGTVQFPGSPANIYQEIPWWDHLTHTLSASVVGVVGYATVRAIDANTETLVLPPRFLFVFLLVMTLAFGVFWELLEFSVSAISSLIGATSVLTQYGLADTMGDLLFDTVGGVLIAIGGTVYLSEYADRLAAWWANGDHE